MKVGGVKTFARLLCGWAIFGCASWAFADDDALPSSVADLRYGVTLYEYYQQNYFAALSELMVADARGGIQGHKDNPQIIAGAIGLAFGMEERAGAAFSELLTENKPLNVRDTAWFYLGKLQYQQGDWAGAGESFNNISAEIDSRLARELAAMRLQILLRNEDYKEAKILFSQLPDMGRWHELVNYNLGVALGRQGEAVQALGYLQAATETPLREHPMHQKVQRALRDRAHTAIGYIHIQQGEYQKAVDAFNAVRLTGPYSDRALLGLGWAWAAQDKYEQALAPWQKLNEGSLQQTSVLESLLAVPFAYEKIGADVAALDAYEGAEHIFAKELEKIQALRAELEGGYLLDVIRQGTAQGNQSWFALDPAVSLKPELAYLSEIFAQNDFQSRVQAVRDLLFMQNNLAQWQQKQDVYADLLVQRGRARAEKVAAMQASGKMQLEASLREQARTIRGWLMQVEKNRDYLALVTDEDMLDQMAWVASAKASVEALEASGESADWERQQLEFYQGVLLWNAQEQFSSNLWAQKSALNELETALDELGRAGVSLQKAIDEAPEILPYQERMSALDQRLAAEIVAIDSQLLKEERALQNQVMAALNAQQVRIKNYLARTRLSVARLYDERLKQ
ncbi:tetratricopeptide repeat protein [Simiduia sp. 21SJ11W-1]|uniref:tetratricopeptide repeat protein n=1 Tax=Simiduia sp. 21SJ11W-1 TaxID=2909669 RepID=UPI00209E36F4|nr:tetratricopeptide repeat protein [Simiduia sp. 21SJ11W-1]UTA47874.1 tetratricopeptide repeat protein [Simiduia sp. 21SJ11W-1]